MRDWEHSREESLRREFELQFRDFLQALCAALGAGYSVENGFRAALEDLRGRYDRDSRIIKELTYMVRELNLHIPFEDVLDEWAARMPQEDLRSFASVFRAAKKQGGNSIRIIRDTADNLCGKVEIRREIRTVTASKRLEFRLMTVIPFAILLYMRLSFPEFMKVLYGSLPGRILMTVCLLLYLGAYLIGRKIIDIEI